MSRYAMMEQIGRLDPVTDHQQIVYLGGAYEYPWLTRKSLEFALFRTYAVPSISRLLDETGQFASSGQRRYDDTSLIIAEITEHGYDSDRGRAAIRRMNRLHGRFQISNDDYLYVLSTFIYEPVRWHGRFGWRAMLEVEKQGAYYFWREVGKRMNIRDIPPTYEAFEQFNIDYERAHFRYSDTNQRVGQATIRIFLNWYAAPLRPLARKVIYALLDEPLRAAFGFPKVSGSLRRAVETGLKAQARMIRYLPPRRSPYSFLKAPNRTYPAGYQIERLGPPDVPPDPVTRPRDQDAAGD